MTQGDTYGTINSTSLVCIEADYLEELEAVADAARIEVARADRFGCRELREELERLDALLSLQDE